MSALCLREAIVFSCHRPGGRKGKKETLVLFFSFLILSPRMSLLSCLPPHCHSYPNVAAFSVPRSQWWWWWWGPQPQLSALLRCLCCFHLSENIAWDAELGCFHWVIAMLLMMHSLIYKEVLWTFVGFSFFFLFFPWILSYVYHPRIQNASENVPIAENLCWVAGKGRLLLGEVWSGAYLTQDSVLGVAHSSRAAMAYGQWMWPSPLGWILAVDGGGYCPFLHLCKLKTEAWGERPGQRYWRSSSLWQIVTES